MKAKRRLHFPFIGRWSGTAVDTSERGTPEELAARDIAEHKRWRRTDCPDCVTKDAIIERLVRVFGGAYPMVATGQKLKEGYVALDEARKELRGEAG